MTLNQLETLSEDELAFALYVVNVIDPPCVPKIEFQPRHLTWFQADDLNKKLVNAFPKVLPEGHAVFTSLMQKLGVKIEINKIEPPCPPTQNETSSSAEPSTNTNSGSATT